MEESVENQRLPAGRHGLSPEFVVHNQRSRIFDAMARRVAEKGYANTSVEHVVQLARVSRRTFYDHFRNKEDCFLQTYDGVVSLMVAEMLKAYRAEDQWAARVRAGIRAFLHFLQIEPHFARMCVVEVVAAGHDALERRDATMRGFVPLIDSIREELEHPEAIPEVTAEAIVGAIYEIVYARLLKREHETIPALLPEIMYLTVVPYLGPEAAQREMEAARAVLQSER